MSDQVEQRALPLDVFLNIRRDGKEVVSNENPSGSACLPRHSQTSFCVEGKNGAS
jgi:hypothetical protein